MGYLPGFDVFVVVLVVFAVVFFILIDIVVFVGVEVRIVVIEEIIHKRRQLMTQAARRV